jgi:hypothetical protein
MYPRYLAASAAVPVRMATSLHDGPQHHQPPILRIP